MDQSHQQPSIEWQQAIAWGMLRYKNNPEIHHHVFASIVAWATSSQPCRKDIIRTMRSDIAVCLVFRYQEPGKMNFEEVIGLISECCFGPITIEYAHAYRQLLSSEDDERDIEDAKALLARESELFHTTVGVHTIVDRES